MIISFELLTNAQSNCSYMVFYIWLIESLLSSIKLWIMFIFTHRIASAYDYLDNMNIMILIVILDAIANDIKLEHLVGVLASSLPLLLLLLELLAFSP